MWRADWGYETIFSCCTSAKAGVAILFNNNFNFKLLKSFSDPQGRAIICDLQIEEKSITLASIYAPNTDDTVFFKNLYDHILDFKCEEIIIGGDFNLVLSIEKDKKGGLPRTHKNTLKAVNGIAETLDLTDVWRVQNPDIQKYTRRQKSPEVHCRLDFFPNKSKSNE